MLDVAGKAKADEPFQGPETDEPLTETESDKLPAKDEMDARTKVAVIMLGNKEVGKSTMLSQLGGMFESRFSFIDGVAKDIKKQQVSINGQPITLISTPGMCDNDGNDNDETKFNSRKLTEVLREDFHFKLFLVLLANSRLVTSEDLALMSRVNQAIRVTKGSKVEFRVIINQIRGDKEYQEYKTRLTRDNLQQWFDHSKEDFDIVIKDIILLRHDENAVKNRGFYNQLASVLTQKPGEVDVTASTSTIPKSFNPTELSVLVSALTAACASPSPIACALPPPMAVGSVVRAITVAAGVAGAFLDFTRKKEQPPKKG